MCPTPVSTAWTISSSVLLLPWKSIRAGSTPARRARNSSPPEATSTDSPSSATRRKTAVQGKALPA